MLCHYASPWGKGEEETPSDSWQETSSPLLIYGCEEQRDQAHRSPSAGMEHKWSAEPTLRESWGELVPMALVSLSDRCSHHPEEGSEQHQEEQKSDGNAAQREGRAYPVVQRDHNHAQSKGHQPAVQCSDSGTQFQRQAPHGARPASHHPQQQRTTSNGHTAKCGPSKAENGLDPISATPSLPSTTKHVVCPSAGGQSLPAQQWHLWRDSGKTLSSWRTIGCWDSPLRVPALPRNETGSKCNRKNAG